MRIVHSYIKYLLIKSNSFHTLLQQNLLDISLLQRSQQSMKKQYLFPFQGLSNILCKQQFYSMKAYTNKWDNSMMAMQVYSLWSS